MRIRIVSRFDVSSPIRDFLCPIDDRDLTLEQFLSRRIKDFRLESYKGVTAVVDGVPLRSDVWGHVKCYDIKYLTFIIEPQGTVFAIFTLIVAIASAIYSFIMMRKMKTKGTNSKESSSIYDVNAQGNQVKLEDPIPEQFGVVKAFPDYIADKHYYYHNNVRYLDLLLCQGVGYYHWSLDQTFIGQTRLSSYAGSDIDIVIADPGQDISGHSAHRCWFNSTEIDSAGKEVPTRAESMRGRGDRQASTATLSDGNKLSLAGATAQQYYSGDYIRIDNLKGPDYLCSTTSDIDIFLDTARVYVTAFPTAEDDMTYSIGKQGTLHISTTDGDRTFSMDAEVTIQNYGRDSVKGLFLDVSRPAITLLDSTTYTLTLHDWLYSGETLSSTHYNDNGIYQVVAYNNGVYTLLAADKRGVGYETMVGWNRFVGGDRTQDNVITELLDTDSSVTTSKSNITSWYRGCPIGATSQYYEVDFNFPSGLYTLDERSGDYKNRTATILLEYRIADSTDEPTQIVKTYTRNTPDEIGETISIDVGTADFAYEFRVTNQSQHTTESNVQQTFVWNGLKCLIAEPTSYEGVTVLAMTIRGSQSLSELSNNQISTLWARKMAPLKDLATAVWEEVEEDGWNTYTFSATQLRNMILASKCYADCWDEIGQDFDAVHLEECTTIKHDSLIFRHKKSDVARHLYGYWPLDEREQGLNTPSTTFRLSFNIRMFTAADSSGNKAYSRSSPAYNDYVYFIFNRIYIPSDRYDTFPTTYNSTSGNANYEDRTLFVRFRITAAYRNVNAYIGPKMYIALGYNVSGTDVIMEEREYPNIDNAQSTVTNYGDDYYPELSTEDKARIEIERDASHITLSYPREIIYHRPISGHHTWEIKRGSITVSVEDYPVIGYQFGTYCAWVSDLRGVASGSHTEGDTTWFWPDSYPQFHIANLSYSLPTKVKVTKLVRIDTSTISEDAEADRSIAAPYRYICENSKFAAYGDIYNPQNLLEFDKLWRSYNQYFDFRFDSSITVLEALQQILQVGFAEPITVGNELNVVMKKADAEVAQFFSPSNMTGDPQIQYNFVTPDDNDEVDCKYTSAVTWKSDEIYVTVDDDNVMSYQIYRQSDKDESVELLAVTDPVRASKLSARRLRELLYGRKQIEFQTELDALNCQYGDLIAVALPQDMAMWFGKVTSYDAETLTITISEELDSWQAGVVYIRRPNGTSQSITAVYNDGNITLSSELDFEPDFSSSTTCPDFAVGRVEKYWVTSVKPDNNNKKCKVSAIIYDNNIFVDDPWYKGLSSAGWGHILWGHGRFGH